MNPKFKEKLRELLVEDGDVEHYNFSKIKGWPQIPEPGYDSNESLDLENCSLLEIGSKTITIVCGGDWQDPHKVIIGLIKDELAVVKFHKGKFSTGIAFDKLNLY